MSRRRPKDIAYESDPSVARIDIVCTGRRTHSRNRLGVIAVWSDTRTVRRIEGPEPYILDPSVDGSADAPHLTRTYKCERCGRSVPLRDATADEILIELATRGKGECDISALHVR